jgi:hypothetical protein
MSAEHDWDEEWRDGLMIRLVCVRCGASIVPLVVIVPAAELDEVRAQLPPDREVWGMSHLPAGHREIMSGPGLAALTGKPPCTYRAELEDR